ncbi:hypothetical protein AB1Y20_003730 [Prymnesium parvum]|uniref:DUF4336 domain-containing protein n=1 Tax=Prymnesium parvum TaxID=97485 RepID=A0AB34J8H9_PRYPA
MLQPAQARISKDADWPLWPALPLAPYGTRKTVLTEVLPGRLWTFDQLLGVFYVHVPIRMSVLRLDSGGLFVYAPVAPTKEVLKMLAPIIAAYGPVRHIVLPSVAPEHKANAGPFARKFPEATFWTTDRQYSFPANLPPTWLGLPRGAKTLPPSSTTDGPLAGELDFEVLTAKASKESVFQEAAFYHRSSRSLFVCDSIISVTSTPPPILLCEPEYRRALLYHARDDPLEKVDDTEEVRCKGWKRIVLFANFFMPGSLMALDPDVWLSAAPKSPMPELGWAGVLPFTWRNSVDVAFDNFAAGGAPTVAPIIQIILSRAPEASLAWLDRVCSWNFERVVPCHFDAPLQLKPSSFREAFIFLDKGENTIRSCDEDIAYVRDSLEGLPPDLALFPTKLGALRGKQCALLTET